MTTPRKESKPGFWTEQELEDIFTANLAEENREQKPKVTRPASVDRIKQMFEREALPLIYREIDNAPGYLIIDVLREIRDELRRIGSDR